MALQPILGYPSDYRAPFTAVEINFAQGPSTSSGPGRTVLYTAPKTSAGSWTAGTVYKVSREQDAIDGAGPGSFLHRLIRLHLLTDKGATIYALPHAASSGAGIATATGTITISGSPTSTGNVSTTVCGEGITTSFTTTDTPTTIAANLVAQINAKTWLPLTAANVAGVVTMTAKTAGASSGDGTVGVLRYRSTPDPGKGITVATSGAALGLGTGTPGADGATTENAGLTSALSGITNSRYYYMGFSAWSSAAATIIRTHVLNKSTPNPGLRCRAFMGYTGAETSLVTIANGNNYERLHFVNQENSEHDAAELCANTLAIHRKLESVTGGFVPDNYRGADWLIKPVYDNNDIPTQTEVNTAVTNGISIISSDPTGSFLVMSCTSRSKDSTGTLNDFRATETHRVSFMDLFADTWLSRHQVTYAGFKLKPDALLSDGSVDVNQKVPAKTVTPSRYVPFLAKIIDEFEDAGMIQNAADWKTALRANIDPLNNGRLELGDSGRTIDILHQTTLRISETSAG
jgi:phage tail sheath gpL-like